VTQWTIPRIDASNPFHLPEFPTMRARLLILVLAILLVGGFAYQNWAEINRSSTLTFGVIQAEAPLGLILLTLLGIALLVFAAGAATMRTQNLVESRQHAKALHAQRELADKAEASRFTDLRQMLDGHLRESRQRETVLNTEMDKAMAQHQRELRNQLEQMYHLLTGRLSEIERRLDSRAAPRELPGVRAENVTPTRVDEPARMGEPVRKTETVRVEPAPWDVPPGRERV
jgi:uncharacterized integral membrane protein